MTSTIKVNTITTESGSTLTIGGCGKTVALASGASQTGFGRSGSVDWQTTPKTTTFTAASGEGYFINSGSALTANLPAGTAGAIVAFSDYARNFNTHNFTISPNGSEKIGGTANDLVLNVNGQALTLIYVDSTKGWVNVQNAEDTETGESFITATGGTVTESGNCKIHTFTGPGTFTVTAIASCAASNIMSHLVVAGGGGAGAGYGGGGGGGGFREVKNPVTPYTASPLDGYPTPGNRITVTAQAYPITVGAGGTGTTHLNNGDGTTGSPSIFSSVTSTGGGVGGNIPAPKRDGGSGGGSSVSGGAVPGAPGTVAGVGNTPPVAPAQGTNGGSGYCGGNYRSGGGGGATVAGSPSPNGSSGGGGGTGATTSISASPTSFSGGGGGGQYNGLPGGGPASPCGTGKAASLTQGVGPNASNNTGGGGGGGAGNTSPGQNGGNGGSGIVVIRYKFQ